MTNPAASACPHDPIQASVAGHDLELIFDGAARLDRLRALIDGAARSIDIVMYIFDDDSAGREIVARLLAAAQRGVRVRAVIDSFGSSDTPDALFAPLRSAGGEILFFSRRWRSSYLIRNHQKLVLIDERIAITGGFNISEQYLSPPRRDCWFDLGLIVEGPSVAQAVRWFAELHAYTTGDDGKLLILRRLIREWPVENGALTWLVGGPTQRLSPWARAVRRDLDRARRLDMAMAYFSPGQGMLRRLGRVARRGRARFVMAAQSDNAATIGASRLLYGYLLRKQADVWEYRPCKLHMKLIVIDDVTYVGSANFDARSLFVNVEIMLRIADAEFAARMRDFVASLEGECEIVTKESHKARAGLLTRLRWTLAWFVVGVADYTVSRRLNFGLAEPDLEAV
ncbi:phosphatidylserine/phosphatidylglycerophosphate/cardiolipin synthase family protein [Sphingopyxis indica]|uniref:phospholipase D-like domain-containing protein n=1 Tax=Sphingopyxis indica TaxID=436663 RepID=UPI0029394826|nr:phosphatidylserine/phosphatidylglycerophosphate/cardiolipin synthase family protein [Sphingopyxis indica]WOF41961.1 phosphatidylserine/phosphatidylglycerophosphate/cardiolipin synthase family protein [Sphingopyxis indica]